MLLVFKLNHFHLCMLLYLFVSDIAIFVLKRDVKLQLTNLLYLLLLPFVVNKSLSNLGKTQTGALQGAKCKWGSLNARSVAKHWRLLTRSVVNSVRSQIYHTERPPYLFAARRAGLSATADNLY